MVQGHVDGVGTVLEPGPDLRIQIQRDLERYFVEGLCNGGRSEFDLFRHQRTRRFPVALIPHTLK